MRSNLAHVSPDYHCLYFNADLISLAFCTFILVYTMSGSEFESTHVEVSSCFLTDNYCLLSA